MQSEPQRWSRLGACRGTSASDAGGERGAAAAGVRSAGPGGPHVRTAEAVAAVPGARGGVWGKPLPAAGNSAGAEPEPRGDGGTREGPPTWGGGGGEVGARVGRPSGAPGGARRPDLGAHLGAFPRWLTSKHDNKAWRVYGGPVQPLRDTAAPRPWPGFITLRRGW